MQENIAATAVFGVFVIGITLLIRSIKKTRDANRLKTERDPRKFNGSTSVGRTVKILDEKEGVFLIEINDDPSYFFHTQIWITTESFPIKNARCGDAYMILIEDNNLKIREVWIGNNGYVLGNKQALC